MKRIISNCHMCSEIAPDDSFGATHVCLYESNEGRKLEGDYEDDIPDWCPLEKVSSNNEM